MRKAKVALTLDAAALRRLNRAKRRRLAAECAKLDPAAEQALAEEGLGTDLASWPAY